MLMRYLAIFTASILGARAEDRYTVRLMLGPGVKYKVYGGEWRVGPSMASFGASEDWMGYSVDPFFPLLPKEEGQEVSYHVSYSFLPRSRYTPDLTDPIGGYNHF
jgi:hypothetical protein